MCLGGALGASDARLRMNDRRDRKDDKIVAISLLTAEELKNVGTGLKRLYPLPEDDDFDDLLQQIDRAVRGGKGRS